MANIPIGGGTNVRSLYQNFDKSHPGDFMDKFGKQPKSLAVRHLHVGDGLTVEKGASVFKVLTSANVAASPIHAESGEKVFLQWEGAELGSSTAPVCVKLPKALAGSSVMVCASSSAAASPSGKKLDLAVVTELGDGMCSMSSSDFVAPSAGSAATLTQDLTATNLNDFIQGTTFKFECHQDGVWSVATPTGTTME